MKKIYNKLVRDNIPNIIRNDGGEPIVRILSDEEYKNELEKNYMRNTKKYWMPKLLKIKPRN